MRPGTVQNPHISERQISKSLDNNTTDTHWSCRTYEWVMSHVWINLTTHINHLLSAPHLSATILLICMGSVARTKESYRTYEGVMSHVRRSHVARASCVTDQDVDGKRAPIHSASALWWVMSHIVSHATPTDESCQTHEWVMSHTWMSHITRMNESCHTHEWVMSHSSSHIEKCLLCDMTHSWECDMTNSCVWHDSFMREMWLIHARDMTYSCVWHDSSMGVAWLTVRDVTHQGADGKRALMHHASQKHLLGTLPRSRILPMANQPPSVLHLSTTLFRRCVCVCVRVCVW